MGVHPIGAAPQTIIAARVLEIAEVLLFFDVHRNHRRRLLGNAARTGVDVLELRIAVGMMGALACLAVCGARAVDRSCWRRHAARPALAWQRGWTPTAKAAP